MQLFDTPGADAAYDRWQEPPDIKEEEVEMETTTEKKPMEAIAEYAKELRSVQEQITTMNATMEALKKQQSQLSDAIVAEAEKIQEPDSAEPLTALVIEGVGVVKLNTSPHPRVLSVADFLTWCRENNVMAPALSINAKTMESWWKEQAKLNLPLPGEEIAPVFWKTTARVNKGL